MVFGSSLIQMNGFLLIVALVINISAVTVRQVRRGSVVINFKTIIFINIILLVLDAVGYFSTSIEAKLLTLYYLNLPFIYYILFDNLLSDESEKVYRGLVFFSLIMLIVSIASIIVGYASGFNYADVSSPLSVLRYVSVGFDNQVIFIMSLTLCHCVYSFLYSQFPSFTKLIILILFTCFVFMTFSRLAMLIVAVNTLLILRIRTSLTGTCLSLVIFAPLFLFMFGEDIFLRFEELKYYASENASNKLARVVFFVNAFQIASENFPAGGGLGSFAGVAAKVFYSPAYFELGMNTVHGLELNAASLGRDYRVDTLLPHFIGELGFIGALLYMSTAYFPIFKIIIEGLRKNVKTVSYFGGSVLLLTLGSLVSTPWMLNPTGLCLTMFVVVSFERILKSI
jgi:hypothetical protein